MNMKSELTALSVLLCFVFAVTLVQSSPVLDYESHSLSKREAEGATAQPEAEPESSTGAAEPEPESSSSTPEAEPEAGKNGTSGEKKGFFKTIGENIKNGASSAMDKVKSAASNVKDSVKKAVNNAASKLKDATDEKTTCKPSAQGTFSTIPQNLQDPNCTMEVSTEMSATAAPAKRKRSTDSESSPDTSSSDNESSDNEDSGAQRNSSSTSRNQKKSQIDISSNEQSSNEPILVHGPHDTANLRPPVFKEKNITIKDTTVPTLPPLGPYPNVKKPGKCPSLAPGLNCVALSNDAAQCRSDSGCPGTKKCCYYACQPYNKDVGVCESPVYYSSVSQSTKF